MPLIIKKYGGTSVGSIERINRLADKIAQAHADGDSIVVVLSAMGGETDRLLELAYLVSEKPSLREYDVLLSTGEQVSVALMSMALQARNVPALSYTGSQAGILTNAQHKKARIRHINTDKLQEDLSRNCVPIVTGFQGVDAAGNITTLGRGGSDTTAVALAAALEADECQIYTDVDGVYTADPRVVPDAHRLDYITFEEMLELASLGAKVLQIRAVEFASKYNVRLRVLPAFTEDPELLPKNNNNIKSATTGTLITYEDAKMEQPLVSGVAFDRNQAKLTIANLPNEPGIAHKIFSPIAQAGIIVDMIVQNSPSNTDNNIGMSFTVPRDEYKEALAILQKIAKPIKGAEVSGYDKVAKLSIVGVGMRSHMGVASTLFEVLANESINILLITTSEIKVSVLIDEKYLELGARALHAAFDLSQE